MKPLKPIIEDYILSWTELERRSVEVKFFLAKSEKIPCFYIDTNRIESVERPNVESLLRRMRQSFFFTDPEVVVRTLGSYILERSHLISAFEAF